ncbi:hypothetical protein H4R35_007470, partial [Dimargaris xerosporica]
EDCLGPVVSVPPDTAAVVHRAHLTLTKVSLPPTDFQLVWRALHDRQVTGNQLRHVPGAVSDGLCPCRLVVETSEHLLF